ncbi:MAG: 50S ribosomal protein L16 [Gammaproteobacteria bacterium]|nr:50S ribosomal protein L16 [Gammaproteobacteria bacterium]
MMQPKRTKYRKQFKGDNAGLAQRGNSVAFGDFGLKATERARMTAREIEAARRAMARHVKRGGQIWIRVFPDVPISKKPLEVRMGSGKGNVEYWVAKVKPGKVLFEMEGVDEKTAREAFRLAGAKLSVTNSSSCVASNSRCACSARRVRRSSRTTSAARARTLLA